MVPQKQEQLSCSLEYYKFSPVALKVFAFKVREKIGGQQDVFKLAKKYYDSIYYANLLERFQMAYANYFIERTIETKWDFEIARTDLLFLLDASAEYVNSIANGDARIIKLAGFTPINNEKNKKKAARIHKKLSTWKK